MNETDEHQIVPMHLKLGKKKARPDAVTFRLASYVTTKLPTIPAVIGHQNVMGGNLGMLGNDQYGDCVFAGAGHETMLWNLEQKRSINFSDRSVLADYSAVTGFNPDDPTTDQGTDMKTAASYRRKVGVADHAGIRHQILAYLGIDAGDLEQLAQGIYLFGAVGVGIKFPNSAMAQFNAEKPWTVVKKSPIEGGHYIPIIARLSNGNYLAITWGRFQEITPAFIVRYMDEALAYVSAEALNAKGVSLEGFSKATLLKDLAAI